MRNLPTVSCRADPMNEASCVVSRKLIMDQGEAVGSFNIQPQGSCSKEQCAPLGRLPVGRIGKGWETAEIQAGKKTVNSVTFF